MMCNRVMKEEIINKLNGDRGPLKCPLCDHGFTHIRVEQLSPEETGTRQGGSAVLLEGECGHVWGDIYAEHKGLVVKVPFVFEAMPILDHWEVSEAIHGAMEEMEGKA